jgi:hypothetical protein
VLRREAIAEENTEAVQARASHLAATGGNLPRDPGEDSVGIPSNGYDLCQNRLDGPFSEVTGGC